jgi:hypothetical protein
MRSYSSHYLPYTSTGHWEAGGQQQRSFRPHIAATWGVAIILLLLATINLGHGAWIDLPVHARYLGYIMIGIGSALLVRALGDRRWMGFFKRVRNTEFARRDTYLYSPLCLALCTSHYLSTW